MATIIITDPNDPSVVGGLSDKDGGLVNFTIDEFTSSEDVKILFNLAPPPTFFDAPMVWGRLDPNIRALSLWLAETAGDETNPFARLDNFSSGSGSGSLFRSNKLPPAINWSLSN
jgi:hypothetical protein